IEPLLQLRRNTADSLEIVGLAPWRLDALEDGRKLLGRWGLGLTDVDASSSLGTLDAVDGRPRCEIAVGRDRTAGVVIAGDWEVDAVRIAIGVDDGHDRNAELLRLLNRDLLLVGVDHEQEVRRAAHLLDAAQRLIELVALARELQHLLLGAADRVGE